MNRKIIKLTQKMAVATASLVLLGQVDANALTCEEAVMAAKKAVTTAAPVRNGNGSGKLTAVGSLNRGDLLARLRAKRDADPDAGLTIFEKIVKKNAMSQDDLENAVIEIAGSVDLAEPGSISNVGARIFRDSNHFNSTMDVLSRSKVDDLGAMGQKLNESLMKIKLVTTKYVDVSDPDALDEAYEDYKEKMENPTIFQRGGNIFEYLKKQGANMTGSMIEGLKSFKLPSTSSFKDMGSLVKQLANDELRGDKLEEAQKYIAQYGDSVAGFIAGIEGPINDQVEGVKRSAADLLKSYEEIYQLQQTLEQHIFAIEEVLLPELESNLADLGDPESYDKATEIIAKQLRTSIAELKRKVEGWKNGIVFIENERNSIQTAYDIAENLLSVAGTELDQNIFQFATTLRTAVSASQFKQLANTILALQEQNQEMSVAVAKQLSAISIQVLSISLDSSRGLDTAEQVVGIMEEMHVERARVEAAAEGQLVINQARREAIADRVQAVAAGQLVDTEEVLADLEGSDDANTAELARQQRLERRRNQQQAAMVEDTTATAKGLSDEIQ